MKVTGLSHIIYTVPSEADIKRFPLIDLYDKTPQISELPPNPQKLPLLDTADEGTRLALFRPVESDLPGLEFIFSHNKSPRHNVSLLIPAASDVVTDTLQDPGNELYSHQNCSWLNEHRCTLGVLIGSSHLDNLYSLLTTCFRCKFLEERGDFLLFKTTVINKSLSGFLIAIGTSEKAAVKNDHPGLSTLGWFARPSAKPFEIPTPFQKTETFDISLPHADFNGQFIYDNNIPSFEILEPKT